MDDDVLIFIVAGAVFLVMGLMGLRNKQVYLGRVIRFVGPKMVMKARIPVLIYGIGMSVGGALAILTGLTESISPDFAALEQMKPASVILAFGGFVVSVLLELFYYSSNLPPYDDVDPQDHADSYRNTYR